MSERSDGATPRFSIAVVSFNARDYLDRCLASVFREARAVSSEVIVVDNASTDGSPDLVRSRHPRATLIEPGENLGYGRAANLAFMGAASPVFLLLNSDLELREGFLRSLEEFLGRHPKAGVTGGRLFGADGRTQPSCRSFPSLAGLFFEASGFYRVFPRHRWIGRYYGTDMDYDREREVDVPLGAMLAIRRETWLALGGMDERFFMYSEETDLCRRARKRGWEVWYAPEVGAVHHGGMSTRALPARMFVENHRSNVLFLRLHGGPIRAFVGRVILFAGVLLRGLAWSVAWLVFSLVSPGRRERAGARVRMFACAAAWHVGLLTASSGRSTGIKNGSAR